jgi:MSHA biogenesis protein MshQ
MRRLLSLFLLLLLCAAGTAARAGETYTFAGNPVNGCSLSGKTYTCPALPLPNWDDKVVISGAYTVTANGDVNFGYNQGLAISGGGTLKISGNLDIGNIQTALLQVNGATLIAGKTFSIGAQVQTITADVTAASMNLGTGSDTKITGKLTATGAVNIASHATIVGPVTGSAIVLGTPVSITGNVTATQSLTIGSGSSVTGNVTTGELTLQSSEAIITGSATVTHATLDWHGRVTDRIVCTAGTTPGQCDCVTNNSGYDIRKNVQSNAPGPYCEGKAQPAPVLDHFVISHPATASVCAPATVKVTACANAACTASYTGGTSVTLQPSGQRIDIGSSGSNSVDLALVPTDKLVLSLLTNGAKPPTSCVADDNKTKDCSIKVSNAAFTLSLNANQSFVAAEDSKTMPPLTISAVIYDDKTKACKPLFDSGQQTIDLSFAYANPVTGKIQPSIAGSRRAAGVVYKVPLTFNGGVAQTSLAYEDAGQLLLSASYAGQGWEAKGSLTVVAAPAAFKVEADLAKPYFAGKPFTVKVTALNRANNATPNFGKELQPVYVKLTGKLCQPVDGVNGFVAPAAPTTIADGVQSFVPTTQLQVPRMDETGAIDLLASLDTSYLDSKIMPSGSTGTGAAACQAALGPFIPAYFDLTESTTWQRTTLQDGEQRKQYYSGEPKIDVTLTARNQQKSPTVNYTKTKSARHVDLVAIDAAAAAGTSTPSALGALNTLKECAPNEYHLVCADDFDRGTATWTKGSFLFKVPKTRPLTAILRATDTDKASSSYAPREPKIVVRSGRVRLSNVFGSAGKPLSMPFNLEYWDGTAWIRNVDDGTTVFGKGADAFAVPGNIKKTIGNKLAHGTGTVLLTRAANAGTASVPIALNLGSAGAKDNACGTAPPKPDSVGADLAFLRSADATCADANPHDPWARASFGVFSDETRRIIHVREVFR